MARKKRNNNNNGNVNQPNNIKDEERLSDTGKNVRHKKVYGLQPHVITDGSTDNDYTWYRNLEAVFKDVSSYSFNSTVGLQMQSLAYSGVVVGNSTVSLRVGPTAYTPAGIMVISTMPTIGVSTNQTSAPNIAAQQLYTLIRKANSGKVNYDVSDPMMLVYAMDSAYMLYEYLLKGYRCISMYNYANRYYPTTLANAMGFSMELAGELANYRAALDLFAYKLASINIPDQFDVIKRHSWLYTNIYSDSATYKAQLYTFVPSGFYQWTEGTSDKPTYLAGVDLSTLTGSTDLISSVDTINKAINALMDPILGSEDVGIISGDIMKAFGDSGCIRIQPVEDNPALVPSYSKEVLSEIENAEWTQYSVAQNRFDITVDYSNTQTGPYLVSEPAYVSGMSREYATPFRGGRNSLLNMHSENPTPDEVMVATRFKMSIAQGIEFKTGTFYVPITSCGTEVIDKVQTYILQADGSYVKQSILKDVAPGTAGVNPPHKGMITNTQFDWGPTQCVWSMPEASTVQLDGFIADLDNYLWLTNEDVKRLNDCAIMSLFAVKDYNTKI